MTGGSALDPRQLLRLLAEQQANVTELQRLVIEHVLADDRAGAVVVTSSPASAAPTGPEPLPGIVARSSPAEPSPSSGVTSDEPEPTHATTTTTSTVLDGSADLLEAAADVLAGTANNLATTSELRPDPPASADSPFGEALVAQSEAAASSTHKSMPLMANSRVSRYLKPPPVPAAKQVSSADLHRISRLCDVGDAAHLVLQFGEYRGATLFQVAQADPNYIRSLALTAQRPQVRAAAIQLVRALEASERPVGRRRSPRSSSTPRKG